MSDKNHSQYDSIRQFEPLLPRQRMDELQAQALEVEKKSSLLGNGIHLTTLTSIQ